MAKALGQEHLPGGNSRVARRAEDIDLARDRRLVEAWQAGDTSAFDNLYRLYFPRLRTFCRRRVGDSAEADDLAQEAFLRALQALPRLTGERRFYPWMTVIASRLCIDDHRRRHRVQPTDDIDLGTVDDGHDERYDLQADLHHLDVALRRLGPRHAEVLDLRESHGLTYHEIADQLGVPHSTVETLLFRARKALRREFAAVSGDRLVAIPAIGWMAARVTRLRDRLATTASELAALGGTLAAGAVTAVLVALPGTTPEPADVVADRARTVRVPMSTTTLVTVPEPAPTVAPTAEMAASSTTSTTEPERFTPIRPLTPEEAEVAASGMPIHLDFESLGLGLDPMPLAEPLLDPLFRLLRREP